MRIDSAISSPRTPQSATSTAGREAAKVLSVANPRLLQRSAKVLETVQAFFDDVDTGGVTEPYGAIVTEGSSRNDCDIGFTQQTISEILRCQAQLTDIYQHVKCALGFNRSHIGNLRDTVEHVITAHIELLAHVDHRLLISLQSGECA